MSTMHSSYLLDISLADYCEKNIAKPIQSPFSTLNIQMKAGLLSLCILRNYGDFMFISFALICCYCNDKWFYS